MMNKIKILSNLYCYTCCSYPFKDVTRTHMSFDHIDGEHITRKVYKIIDFKSWVESDFKESYVLVIKRTSENSKYEFK